MRSWALGALAMLVVAATARAAVLYDSKGFEAPYYTFGKLAGQNDWYADHVTANTATVQSAVARSGTQAVRVASDVTNNRFYPKIDYVPGMGEIISIECDIARTLGGTSPSFGYLVDVYGTDGLRVARAGLGRDAGQIRAIRTLPTGTGPANAVVYSPLDWVHFEMQLNFASHTWALFIDGAPAGTGLPMLNAFAPGLGSADLQIATFNSSADEGYFDNYTVRTVPAPGAIVLVAIGLAVAARRKR